MAASPIKTKETPFSEIFRSLPKLYFLNETRVLGYLYSSYHNVLTSLEPVANIPSCRSPVRGEFPVQIREELGLVWEVERKHAFARNVLGGE
jgi:hypothetical protein